MRHTGSVRCTLCKSIMVFVHQRGSTGGMFVCPVCASQQRRNSRFTSDEAEEGTADMRFRPEDGHINRMRA